MATRSHLAWLYSLDPDRRRRLPLASPFGGLRLGARQG